MNSQLMLVYARIGLLCWLLVALMVPAGFYYIRYKSQVSRRVFINYQNGGKEYLGKIVTISGGTITIDSPVPRTVGPNDTLSFETDGDKP